MLRHPIAKVIAFLLGLAPLGLLGGRAYTDDLTANPIEYVTHFTGIWALRFLVLALAITPLRRGLRTPDLARFRRMVGLFAFFYATLHFFAWLGLDKFFDAQEILADLARRRFITVGFLAFVCLVPLAVTSTRAWIRRLGGKRWQRLHRLVYVSAVAAVVHFFWLVKSDIREPLLYAGLVAGLFALRLVPWWFGARVARAS